MTLPNAIKVGAYSYAVERVERLCNADHQRLNGYCDYQNFVVQIDDGLPLQRERVVLLHELLHAIEDERSAHLTEEQINQFAHALAKLLLDNPDLTRLFLTDEANERITE